jgi:hypothetical protein
VNTFDNFKHSSLFQIIKAGPTPLTLSLWGMYSHHLIFFETYKWA